MLCLYGKESSFLHIYPGWYVLRIGKGDLDDDGVQ